MYHNDDYRNWAVDFCLHEIVLPLFTVSKSNWKLERLFLRREGRQKTWRKPPWARTRTHNKLNSNVMPSLGIEPGPQWWQPLALCEKEQWRAIVQNDSFRNSLQWQSYIINSFDKPIHLFFWKHLFHCAKHKKCYPSYLVMGTVNIFRNFLSFFDRPLMVLVQKITYVAFSVHDGMYSESW